MRNMEERAVKAVKIWVFVEEGDVVPPGPLFENWERWRDQKKPDLKQVVFF